MSLKVSDYSNFVYFYVFGNIIEAEFDVPFSQHTVEEVRTILMKDCHDLLRLADEVMTIEGISIKRRGVDYHDLDDYLNAETNRGRPKIVVKLYFLDMASAIVSRHNITNFIRICENVTAWHNNKELL